MAGGFVVGVQGRELNAIADGGDCALDRRQQCLLSGDRLVVGVEEMFGDLGAVGHRRGQPAQRGEQILLHLQLARQGGNQFGGTLRRCDGAKLVLGGVAGGVGGGEIGSVRIAGAGALVGCAGRRRGWRVDLRVRQTSRVLQGPGSCREPDPDADPEVAVGGFAATGIEALVVAVASVVALQPATARATGARTARTARTARAASRMRRFTP